MAIAFIRATDAVATQGDPPMFLSKIKRVSTTFVVATTAAAGLIGATQHAASAADVAKLISPNAPAIAAATSAAGDNIRVKFQGLSGQAMNIATSGGTFASNCAAQLSVLKPDGVTVLGGPVCAGRAGALNAVPITAAGLYTVLVDPQGSAV